MENKNTKEPKIFNWIKVTIVSFAVTCLAYTTRMLPVFEDRFNFEFSDIIAWSIFFGSFGVLFIFIYNYNFSKRLKIFLNIFVLLIVVWSFIAWPHFLEERRWVCFDVKWFCANTYNGRID